jgi:hypothetical protein
LKLEELPDRLSNALNSVADRVSKLYNFIIWAWTFAEIVNSIVDKFHDLAIRTRRQHVVFPKLPRMSLVTRSGCISAIDVPIMHSGAFGVT